MNKVIIVIAFVVIFVSVILFVRLTGMANVTSINTCTDTDAKDYSSKGKVYGVYYMFTKQNYTKEDYCEDEETLVEYYCVQDGIHSYRESIKYKCELGCLDGACIHGEPVQTEEKPAPPSRSPIQEVIDRIRSALGI